MGPRWVERLVGRVEPAASADDARPAADPADDGGREAFARAMAGAAARHQAYQTLVGQLEQARRAAESPIPLDRATMPLDMPLGPEKLKLLANQIKLSAYLGEQLKQVVARFREDERWLRGAERRAEALATDPGLRLRPDALQKAERLFTFLAEPDAGLDDYPAVRSLLRETRDAAVAAAQHAIGEATAEEAGGPEGEADDEGPDLFLKAEAPEAPAPAREGAADEREGAPEAPTPNWPVIFAAAAGVAITVAACSALAEAGRPATALAFAVGVALLGAATVAAGAAWRLADAGEQALARLPRPEAPEPAAEAEPNPPFEEEDLKDPETVMKLIGVPEITLEVGKDLVSLIDPALGGDLMDRIVPMRVNIAYELGFVLPGIVLKDDWRLPPNAYRIRMKDVPIAQGELRLDAYLAIPRPSTDTSEALPGDATTEPVFGEPALWIARAAAQRAAQLGWEVQDPTNVLVAHLDEVVRANAWELLTIDHVRKMAHHLEDSNPKVVDAALYFDLSRPNRLEFAEYHQVLRLLLRDRVSIRDQVTILEAIAHALRPPRESAYVHLNMMLDSLAQFSEQQVDRTLRTIRGVAPNAEPEVLAAAARRALARQLSHAVAGPDGVIEALVLRPAVEDALAEAARRDPHGADGGLRPETRARLVQALRLECGAQERPVIVCDPAVRRAVARLVGQELPRVRVLGRDELHPAYKLRVVGEVALAEA